MSAAEPSSSGDDARSTPPVAPATQPASLRFGEGVGMFLFSLAEASFLFILPEVLLTFFAVQGRKRAVLTAIAWGLAGAFFGALLMYSWGAGASLKVKAAFLGVIPGITRDMAHEVLQLLQLAGLPAVFVGMLQGIPGKMLAALSPHAGLGLGQFILVFLAARLVLFTVAASLAWAIAAIWRRLLPRISPLWGWGAFWLAFHALWFFGLPV